MIQRLNISYSKSNHLQNLDSFNNDYLENWKIQSHNWFFSLENNKCLIWLTCTKITVPLRQNRLGNCFQSVWDLQLFFYPNFHQSFKTIHLATRHLPGHTLFLQRVDRFAHPWTPLQSGTSVADCKRTHRIVTVTPSIHGSSNFSPNERSECFPSIR